MIINNNVSDKFLRNTHSYPMGCNLGHSTLEKCLISKFIAHKLFNVI